MRLLIGTLTLIAAFSTLLCPACPAGDTAAVILTEEEDVRQPTGIVESHSQSLQFPLTPERQEQLVSYARFVNRWRLVSFALEVVILSAVLISGFSARIRDWVQKVTSKRLLQYAIYLFLFMIVLFMVKLPIGYYRGFIIEHQYGFSNQNLGGWLSDRVLYYAVDYVIMLIVVVILYTLLEKTRRWWLYLAGAAFPFMVFMMIVYPTVIDPLFNEFKPVPDDKLRTAMTELAEKAGIHDPDIYRIDTSKRSNKVNAYFVGIFGTKRIVLYDNMIDNFTLDEMRYVVGHEMGHYVKNHIWYGIFGFVLAVLFGGYIAHKTMPGFITKFKNRLGFEKPADIAGYPLLLLFVAFFSFFTQPIWNAVSRQMEYACDRYGMEIADIDGAVAQSTFEKLSAFNLSDPNPSAIIEFWFYDHPSLNKRIEHAYKVYEDLNQ